jgi:hypothetical protein
LGIRGTYIDLWNSSPYPPLLGKDTREQDARINYYPDLSTSDRVGRVEEVNEVVLKHLPP